MELTIDTRPIAEKLASHGERLMEFPNLMVLENDVSLDTLSAVTRSWKEFYDHLITLRGLSDTTQLLMETVNSAIDKMQIDGVINFRRNVALLMIDLKQTFQQIIGNDEIQITENLQEISAENSLVVPVENQIEANDNEEGDGINIRSVIKSAYKKVISHLKNNKIIKQTTCMPLI